MTLTPLGRELTLALLFKIVAIFALYALFFSPSHRVKVTPADMTAALADRAPASR
ncbi:phosphoglycerate mutase [Methylocystis sp. WRRC1]|uniref:cytochrome oxidase putative small subunit CydP n=1 Tax=unclassified Methylocystis TaxID=2625913 RepID=UPI0001F870E6|nr:MULTISPECIES: cytochrome oxidase putative small subunit CydP [unclassified Methylocystis]MCC3245684.1 phosphoglycerate mutase [Methylocystis sp. WRRC1]